MIRLLLAALLPVAALGLSAAFVAPSVLATGGEPIVVAGAAPAQFEPAAFEGSPCASTLLYAQEADGAPAELRIVAIDLQPGAAGLRFRFREVRAGATLDDAALVLLVDASGRIMAARYPDELSASFVDDALSEGCDPPVSKTVGAV